MSANIDIEGAVDSDSVVYVKGRIGVPSAVPERQSLESGLGEKLVSKVRIWV